MFYDYYAFNPPNGPSTKNKFLSSAASYHEKHNFYWHKLEDKEYNGKSKKKCEAREIAPEAVMELFNMHHNKTPPQCFEEFIPLYPKSSSFLSPKGKSPKETISFTRDFLRDMYRLPNKRIINKVFIRCGVDLRIFNDINKMNEPPMIEEAPIQDLHKNMLVEDLLLFLTNIRLRDILKMKKKSFEMWNQESEKDLENHCENDADAEVMLEIEALFASREKMRSSDSSDLDNFEEEQSADVMMC